MEIPISSHDVLFSIFFIPSILSRSDIKLIELTVEETRIADRVCEVLAKRESRIHQRLPGKGQSWAELIGSYVKGVLFCSLAAILHNDRDEQQSADELMQAMRHVIPLGKRKKDKEERLVMLLP